MRVDFGTSPWLNTGTGPNRGRSNQHNEKQEITVTTEDSERQRLREKRARLMQCIQLAHHQIEGDLASASLALAELREMDLIEDES
jgi:hypothetical protein